MRGHRGFTLIELFVLLVVMALLAAILLPVMMPHHHRGAARQSKSLNNMKQLAVATMMYQQDYHDAFPGWVRNPDGSYAHNVWDEQINPYVKSKDVFSNGGRGIRSYSDPSRQRVLTYGINALLLAPGGTFDGHADFNGARPRPLTVRDVTEPAGTILFAELATAAPMPGEYGRRPDPIPDTGAPWVPEKSEAWTSALDGWIDISPKDFVETTGSGSYSESSWDASRGVARDLYGGGGNYAFVDGHVKFMKIGETVGLDEQVKGLGAVVPGNAWDARNTRNLWNPLK